MVPELVAAKALRLGWGREEASGILMVDFPTLTAAEINKVLDTVCGVQSGQPVERGTGRAEAS
jgi:hypothetical protein